MTSSVPMVEIHYKSPYGNHVGYWRGHKRDEVVAAMQEQPTTDLVAERFFYQELQPSTDKSREDVVARMVDIMKNEFPFLGTSDDIWYRVCDTILLRTGILFNDD